MSNEEILYKDLLTEQNTPLTPQAFVPAQGGMGDKGAGDSQHGRSSRYNDHCRVHSHELKGVSVIPIIRSHCEDIKNSEALTTCKDSRYEF